MKGRDNMKWTKANHLPPIENPSQQVSINVTARLATDVLIEAYVSHITGTWYDRNSVRIYGKVTAWQPL